MLSTRARAAAALAPAALVAAGLVAAPAQADTGAKHTVCASGCDYASIGAAVAAASAGDTIAVNGGTYTESVVVDKQLTISATRGTTVIPGPSYDNAGFKLAAEDVTISGFTIGNRSAMSGTVAIDVSSSTGATIDDVILVNNQRGISLSGAHDVTITDSRLTDNNGSGPDNNAALWGDAVDGLTVTGSTFTGHTNTAINLAGSQDITIRGNQFVDNANLAVIWGDTDVTIADNLGTLMRSSGVYLNHSTNVSVTGNDLTARGGISAVSVNNVDGANTAVTVSGNQLHGFERGVGIGANALAADGDLVATGNDFDATLFGVRNASDKQVVAQGNWWGDASGPAEAGGTGVSAFGPVDYSSWCSNATCTAPVVKATPKLRSAFHTQRDGDNVVTVTVKAGQATTDGGVVAIRQGGKRLGVTVVKHGKAKVNLGTLKKGKQSLTVVFRGTDTVDRGVKVVTYKVR